MADAKTILKALQAENLFRARKSVESYEHLMALLRERGHKEFFDMLTSLEKQGECARKTLVRLERERL